MPRPWAFEAIGTSWEIVTDVPVPAVARREIAGVIERFDRAWSRFRADSAVTALAAGAGVAVATEDAAAPPVPDVAADSAAGDAGRD